MKEGRAPRAGMGWKNEERAELAGKAEEMVSKLSKPEMEGLLAMTQKLKQLEVKISSDSVGRD